MPVCEPPAHYSLCSFISRFDLLVLHLSCFTVPSNEFYSFVCRASRTFGLASLLFLLEPWLFHPYIFILEALRPLFDPALSFFRLTVTNLLPGELYGPTPPVRIRISDAPCSLSECSTFSSLHTISIYNRRFSKEKCWEAYILPNRAMHLTALDSCTRFISLLTLRKRFYASWGT